MTFDQVSRRAVDELRHGLEEAPVPQLHILVRRERRRRTISTVAVLAFVVAVSVPLLRLLSPSIPDVGHDGELPTTSAAWSRVMLESPPTDAVVSAITAGGSGLVAVGADDQAAAWTSPDGRTWARIPNDLGPGAISDVTAGSLGLVAVGDQYNELARRGNPNGLAPVIWTSIDGLNWNRSDPGLNGSMLGSVIAAGPGVVAVGQDRLGPQAWFSFDALTWTQGSRLPSYEYSNYPGGESYAHLADVALAGNQLVATGEVLTYGPVGLNARVDYVYDVLLWISADGMTWTSVSIDPDVFPRGSRISSIVGGPDGFVAVGSTGGDVFESRGDKFLVGDPAVWTSPDGVRWQRVSAERDSFFSGYPYGLQADGKYVYPYLSSVARGTDGYVAVGGDGAHCEPELGACGGSREAAMWASADGQTWVRVPTGPAFQGDDPSALELYTGAGADSVVAWENQYVAVGGFEGGQAIWISE